MPLEPVANEELLQHEEREEERRQPGREGRHAAPQREDDLDGDGDTSEHLEVAKGDEAALQHPLRIMNDVFGVVLLLVEDAQMKEEAEERHGSHHRREVVMHRPPRLGQGAGQELVGRVVGGDQHAIAERREALRQIGEEAPGERRVAGQEGGGGHWGGLFHEDRRAVPSEALTSPALLSQRERREKGKRDSVCIPLSPFGVWTGDMGNTCTETWVTLFREAVSRKEGKRHALAGAGPNVSETGIRDAGLG